MFGVICTLAAVVLLAYFVIKNYYPPIILLVIGLLLLLIGYFMGNAPVSAKTATNFLGFDLAQAFTDLTKSRLGGLGLNIMAIGGFATYMNKIGASKALVKMCVRPLSAIHSPYVLLGLTYVVGQCMALFINSAVGLGLLLMASVYPLLVQLGVRRAAAAAVIGSTCCLDLGPSSSNAMRAADLVQTDVVSYFINGQIPVAICIIIAVAVGHALVQRWFDRREAAKGIVDQGEGSSEKTEDAFAGAGPAHYAILPILPLFLLILFSPMVYAGIKLSLVTAIIVSILIAFIVDLITRHNFKDVCKDSQAFFEGMGKVFTSTVALILCAELFSLGLTKIGGISTMIQAAAAQQDVGLYLMLFVMMAIMTIATIVTGSGNSAFFAFSPLLPEAAASVGYNTVALVVPVQLAASLARPMSPIAGVIIAVSGISGISPIAIIRRTIPVMVLGMIVNVIASQLFL
mgnify:CR=1 FL=1